MIKVGLITVVTGIFILTTVLCPAAENAGNNGKTLFENYCGKCHDLDRTKSRKKTTGEWETTVLRMMKKQNGATITDDEAKIIINYLSETHNK